MGLLTAIFRASTASWSPDDDRWYAPVGVKTDSGVRVTPESALTLSAIFHGVRIYAETLGSLPLEVRRRRGRSKAPDPDALLWPILHDQPNEYQSAQEWIEFMTGVAVLRGNSFSEIISGPRGFVEQLLPIHPNRVKIERVKGTYRLQYRVMNLDDGGSQILPRERIFHLRGFGSDGFVGLSIGDLARQSIGLSLAMESYGARLFSQGVRPSGVLEVGGRLLPVQRDALKADIRGTYSGLENAHDPLLLEGGMKWTQIGLTNQDAQFLESRSFQVLDMCRWLNLKPQMLMFEKTSTYASAEQFGREHVTYSIRPWAHRWRQQIQVQLITEPDTFAEFEMSALLQGTTLERYQAHRLALGGRAWATINEVREVEGLDPDATPGSDEVQQPANVGTVPGDPRPPTSARLDAIVRDAIGRAIRREQDAVTKAHARFGGHLGGAPERWRIWVDEFYARHAAYVAEALKVNLGAAQAFAQDHRAALLAEGIAVLATWETEAPIALSALVESEEAIAWPKLASASS